MLSQERTRKAEPEVASRPQIQPNSEEAANQHSASAVEGFVPQPKNITQRQQTSPAAAGQFASSAKPGSGGPNTSRSEERKRRVTFDLDEAKESQPHEDFGQGVHAGKGSLEARSTPGKKQRDVQPEGGRRRHRPPTGPASDPERRDTSHTGAGEGCQPAILVLDIEDPDSVLDAEVSHTIKTLSS